MQLTKKLLLLVFSILLLAASVPAVEFTLTEIPDCEAEGLNDCDLVVGIVLEASVHTDVDPPIEISYSYLGVEVDCWDPTAVNLAYYDETEEIWVTLESTVTRLGPTEYKVTASFPYLGYIAIIKTVACIGKGCDYEGGYITDPPENTVSVGEELTFKFCGLTPGCEAIEDGSCDENCPLKVDPDCAQSTCENTDDDCCLIAKDDEIDPDCYPWVDPDSDGVGHEKIIYVCDEKLFHKVDSEPTKTGYCERETFCVGLGENYAGECTYLAEDQHLGANNFVAYFCDENDCYKFTEGKILVCEAGVDCGFDCVPGECDFINNRWCSEQGFWGIGVYCAKCGKYDSDCEGTCKDGACDLYAGRYCKEGYWTQKDYCSPERCGPYDSDCLIACETTACDIVNNMWCTKDMKWKSDPTLYCTYCCKKDSLCYEYGACQTCEPGACDTEENKYCAQGVPNVWLAEPDVDYCSECGAYDADCGPEECFQDHCDTNAKKICIDGQWIDPGAKYCYRGYCGTVDPDVCLYVIPCVEDWECLEYSNPCDGIYTTTTCLNWNDGNGCNTFFDYKGNELLDCYFNFTCAYPDNDKDGDGYVYPTCYDEELMEVLGDPDWDCDDKNDEAYPDAQELCNGIDDNCDDSKDEDCPCQPGENMQCGTDEGECREGIQTCMAGYWSVCGGSGYVGPKKEVCDDQRDNNCNGLVDENCYCKEGETQECGSNAGICTPGTQACYNNEWGICTNATTGTDEICDNELDDDCDGFIDGEDASCQVPNPVIVGPSSCSNRIQDGDEIGVDCGGSCLRSCETQACDYGKIEDNCICGKVEYRTGYCCNGKYSITECQEEMKDSDGDGLSDDKELQLGTDPHNSDTDEDTILDGDDPYPLCNEDGICDSELTYPETFQNCQDCGEVAEGIPFFIWLLIIIILLALIGVGGVFYAKKKGYKIEELIGKFIKKKQPAKPTYPGYGAYKAQQTQKPSTGAKPVTETAPKKSKYSIFK